MRLARWHRDRGDSVTVTRDVSRSIFEPRYDLVYGSAIFRFSEKRIDLFRRHFPTAIIAGTGTSSPATVEAVTGDVQLSPSYDGYPDFQESIGFTQRGCRLQCKFCVVPKKEGSNASVSSISEIWRGEPWPRKLHLLDNDFFGQPSDMWKKRIDEIKTGGFKVCFSQGINIRLIGDEEAAALSSIEYRDTKFRKRRLYTAWDNIGDEKTFFSGVRLLEKYGIPAKNLMVYMLVGFDPRETWEKIWHRFFSMTEIGISPYPMVFDRSRKDLLSFQRWVVNGLYRIVPWDQYVRTTKSPESLVSFEKHQKGLSRTVNEEVPPLESIKGIAPDATGDMLSEAFVRKGRIEWEKELEER